MWWIRRQGRVNRTIHALHKKHGPIVRIAPKEVSVNSVGGLKTIYIGGFEKANWYADFKNFNAPNMVSIKEYGPHSVLKRMLSNVYSNSYILNSLDLQKIARVLLFDRLLPVLHAEARDDMSSSLDAYQLGKAIGMDFTAAYLFGLSNVPDYIRHLEDWDQWQRDYDNTKHLTPAQRAFCKTEQKILSLCDAAVAFTESKKSNGHGDEMATEPVVHSQLWRSLQEKYQSRSEYNRILAASEMMDHLIAGHETTGITLAYAMYELSRNPVHQRRLRAELLSLSPPITTQPLSSSSVRSLPSFQSIDSLPFLDVVIRETLRLYPAAGAPQPRIIPSNKHTVIEGYTIPAGVTVSSSAYTLHRNTTVFPDPESWLPDRWLAADTDHLEEMKRWWWPFGSGGRMCIGSHFATLILKLGVAAVYTNYSSFVVDDEGIEPLDSFIASPTAGKVILGLTRL
ncbi:hypothetical protein VTO42DRAFT_8208 [Malbranchea cinnamomea]